MNAKNSILLVIVKTNDYIHSSHRTIESWCYDTETNGYLKEEKPYIYDESTENRAAKGGSYEGVCYLNRTTMLFISMYFTSEYSKDIGFRVVRTA